MERLKNWKKSLEKFLAIPEQDQFVPKDLLWNLDKVNFEHHITVQFKSQIKDYLNNQYKWLHLNPGFIWILDRIGVDG